MAFTTYLTFNSEDLPLPVSYEMTVSDVESDSGGETEAGTMQRDIVRTGVVDISSSFQVSKAWLMKLSAYRNQASITVTCFNTETMEKETASMYKRSFKASLVSDTSKKGLWTVSLTLKEF